MTWLTKSKRRHVFYTTSCGNTSRNFALFTESELFNTNNNHKTNHRTTNQPRDMPRTWQTPTDNQWHEICHICYKRSDNSHSYTKKSKGKTKWKSRHKRQAQA